MKDFTLVELVIVIVIIGMLSLGVSSVSYSLASQKTYTGTVVNITGLSPTAIITNRQAKSMAFSFAVEMQTMNDLIYFSSEDRKFGIVNKGDNIEVMVRKYPPWEFEQAGGLYNGRLIKKLR
jgi:prepilin-type N-terminal cleavage/methylation domain-containing protein